MTAALRSAVVRELRREAAYFDEHVGRFCSYADRHGMTAAEVLRERMTGLAIDLLQETDDVVNGWVPHLEWTPLLLLLVAEAVEAGDLP